MTENTETSTRDFLEQVFAGLQGYTPVASFSGGGYGLGQLNREEWFELPVELPDMADYVERNGRRDLYFTPMIFDAPHRRQEHATRTRCVWADADDCPPERFAVAPSLTVQTSPDRHQCYWLLSESVEAEEAAGAARRIAYTHAVDGCDTGGWDVGQLLRIPGSMHTKRTPFPVHTGGATGELHTLAALQRHYPYEAVAAVEAARVEREDVDLDRVAFHIRQRLDGTSPHEGVDRSKDRWMMILTSAQMGYTDGQILTLLDSHPPTQSIRSDHLRRDWDLTESKEIAKARLKHDHPGSACDQAECGETPEFMKQQQQEAEIVVEESDKYAAMRAKLMTSAQLEDVPPPRWLVRNVLQRDSLNWIYGTRASGKSFTALDLSAHIALGRNWRGHRISAPGTVVYMAAEGLSGFYFRVRAWEKHHDVDRMDNIFFYPEPVQVLQAMERGSRMEPNSDFAVFIAMMEEIQPDMIIFDTQARISVGMEENSNSDATTFVENMENLRTKTGAAVVLVHHTPKDNGGTLRGAGAFEGAAQTLIQLTKDKDSGAITIKNTKQKDAPEFDDLQASLVSVDISEWAKDEDSPTSMAVLDRPAAPQEGTYVEVSEPPKLTPAVKDILDVVRKAVAAAYNENPDGATANELWNRESMRRADGKKPGPGTLKKALNRLVYEKDLVAVAGRNGSTYYLPEWGADIQITD